MHPLADTFAYSYHLPPGQCNDIEEKLDANHFWELKGLRVMSVIFFVQKLYLIVQICFRMRDV